MGNVGRPSKLNEIVIATLEKAYSVGMTTKLSCEYAGVSTSTFFTWMQRGKYEEGTIYAELYQRVKKAESSHALATLDHYSVSPEVTDSQGFNENQY